MSDRDFQSRKAINSDERTRSVDQQHIRPDDAMFDFNSSTGRLIPKKDIEGNLIGDVTGDLTGDVIGDLTGDVYATTKFPSEGLALYYPLDGDVTDASVNGKDGTPTDITYVAGISGEAASFNGSSSEIVVPSSMPGGDITVAMWIKAAKNTTFRRLFEQTSGAANRVLLIANNEEIQWISERSDGTTDTFTIAPTASWTANEWTHIVAVQDGLTTLIYTNGGLIDSDTHADIYTGFGAFPVVLGSSGAIQFFDGLMDEVRIYDRALTAAEIHKMWEFPGISCGAAA